VRDQKRVFQLLEVEGEAHLLDLQEVEKRKRRSREGRENIYRSVRPEGNQRREGLPRSMGRGENLSIIRRVMRKGG